MRNKINQLIFKLFSRRYCYSVRIIYMGKEQNKIFDYYQIIMLVNKYDVLNNRLIKKIDLPLHKKQNLPKYLLKNGILDIEIIAYLGWLKK